MFNPIWNPKFAPIKLIIYIHTPPSIELNINFNILLSGIINIFPNINKTIIQVKKVIIILKSKVNHLFINFYDLLWTNITFIYAFKLYFFLYKFHLSYLVQFPFSVLFSLNSQVLFDLLLSDMNSNL